MLHSFLIAFSLFSLLCVNFSNFTRASLFFNKKESTRYDTVNPDDPEDYGVDHSSPMHYGIDRDTVFGQRYQQLMEGETDSDASSIFDKFSLN